MTLNPTQLQTRLNHLGFSLRVDGQAGPQTYLALLEYVGGRDLTTASLPLAAAMVTYLPQYQIDTPLRIAHFLGQTAIESGGFVYTREIWGPTPTQLRYEGRADLGNNQAGDGYRFRGRGLLQTTGRFNYDTLGRRLGLDLLAHPELLEQPDTSVRSACDYWNTHGLSKWADADDVRAVSRGINRGNPNADRPAIGEAERIIATTRAKAVLV
jgi:putative chitinase